MVEDYTFKETARAHIRELLDSIEHHERHLESTESVSFDNHVEALEAIQQERDRLETHFTQENPTPGHPWHEMRAMVDERIQRMKEDFARFSG